MIKSDYFAFRINKTKNIIKIITSAFISMVISVVSFG